MNTLSKRLFSALSRPIISDYRPVLYNYPSEASVEVLEPNGSKRVIGSCVRQLFYKRKSASHSEERNVDWFLSAQVGNNFCSMLRSMVDEFSFSLGLQIVKVEHSFFDKELEISGRTDLLVWDTQLQEMVGVEIKSVGEWKADKCIEEPHEEHVLQCMIYLDHYQRHIPKGQLRPNKWYIWYLARVDSWNLKAKKHQSPLTNLWDFQITLHEKGYPVIHSAVKGAVPWPHITLDKVYSRFKDLKKYVESGSEPPRDFDMSYSEEKIAGLHKRGLLTKTNSKVVESWLKKGAKKGSLKLEMGDFECRACPWKSECWRLPKGHERQIFDLPRLVEEKVKETSSPEIL